MITKGVIIRKSENENKWMVRIPIFEEVGNSSVLDDPNSPVYEASVSYSPGILDSYLPGDIVYLSFEDNSLSTIIILGKLYQGDNVDPISFAKLDKLYVNSDTELNGNIKVNGLDLSMIGDHNQAIDNLINKTDSQGRRLDELGDWVIEASRDNLVLNFYRRKDS